MIHHDDNDDSNDNNDDNNNDDDDGNDEIMNYKVYQPNYTALATWHNHIYIEAAHEKRRHKDTGQLRHGRRI
jgi:hypothetical protein